MFADAKTSITDPADGLPHLAPRPPDSHKGSFGSALLIGGSVGMSGAIALAGMAALRGGAGLVRLAVPTPCQAIVAGFEPSYMVLGLPSDGEGRIAGAAREMIAKECDRATAIACGPGLGRSAELSDLVAGLFANLPQPLVLDADALNALAERMDGLPRPAGPRVLTPHPGEFARLLGTTTSSVKTHREPLADELALRLGAVVVVKGHHTYIADGGRSAVNSTGNPGMATGGTGDVLTGLITALLCQGLDAFDASRLGVHLHGLAGDLAAAELGEVSLIASDLIRYLPKAIRQHGAL
ncbi:MAG: NAD(P)H-hydrate dehydratase [Planctomycetes bacterium]|nr:NAD(P)H-hydrate dehydratase [Planctomycetota bacterium]